MAQPFQISLGDKLALGPLLLKVGGSALYRLATRPFVGGAKQATLLKDVAFAAVRSLVSDISTPTEQWMNPTTEAAYLDFVKSKGVQPQTDILPSGLKVFWLGKQSAKKVVLYFHGGGYAVPCSPAHLSWLFNLQRHMSQSHDVSVVLVGYTLSPYEPYPAQLRQAAESLEWLVQTKHISPSQIVVAGDSAGGNLSLGLISHLLHPHEAIASKFALTEPLAGTILISPWVKFAMDDGSVTRNATSDLIAPPAGDRWAKLFLNSNSPDNYNQPILADTTWFSGMNSVVKEVLIWAGGAEILLDSIQAFATKLKSSAANVEVVVQPGAAHVDFIFDTLFGIKTKAEGTKVIESWIEQRI